VLQEHPYAQFVSEGDDLLSVDEAVVEFRRSRKTIFGWLQEGRLTRYRSEGDRRTLVSRRELRKLVEPRSTPARESRPRPPEGDRGE
jgi:hypothetical protein